ncbi:hypothetical protein C8R43DRAFT_1127004 [Mycena crocata]|nr:hypothetical protein C8R43DRAFT_1127004 [Mycena crocata]
MSSYPEDWCPMANGGYFAVLRIRDEEFSSIAGDLPFLCFVGDKLYPRIYKGYLVGDLPAKPLPGVYTKLTTINPNGSPTAFLQAYVQFRIHDDSITPPRKTNFREMRERMKNLARPKERTPLITRLWGKLLRKTPRNYYTLIPGPIVTIEEFLDADSKNLPRMADPKLYVDAILFNEKNKEKALQERIRQNARHQQHCLREAALAKRVRFQDHARQRANLRHKCGVLDAIPYQLDTPTWHIMVCLSDLIPRKIRMETVVACPKATSLPGKSSVHYGVLDDVPTFAPRAGLALDIQFYPKCAPPPRGVPAFLYIFDRFVGEALEDDDGDEEMGGSGGGSALGKLSGTRSSISLFLLG